MSARGTAGAHNQELTTSDLLTPHAKNGISGSVKTLPNVPADVHLLLMALYKRIGALSSRLSPDSHVLCRDGDKRVIANDDHRRGFNIGRRVDTSGSRRVYKVYYDKHEADQDIRVATLYARSTPGSQKELPGDLEDFEFIDPARMRVYNYVDSG